ncbi:MAG: class I SAM-dependent methyltransferase [Candidatus Coatesbacteria bacterium]|nr:MAG: class I SAM-dependent methyltransferase [Candidatus Coatesbacteria bacterium]
MTGRRFDEEAWRAVEEAIRLENERQRAADLPPEQRYRSLHPEAAAFLYMLAAATGARRILEVGTSAGYSTLWLARACAATGGRVVTLERNREAVALAEDHFNRAGVTPCVDVVVGDARETLAGLDMTFDFGFVDGEKSEYVEYGQLLWPKLSAGASLVADNVLSHAEATAPFLAYVSDLPAAATEVVALGNGLSWTVKLTR